MFTVITSQFTRPLKKITKEEAIHLITTENPFISGDYHLLKETNKKHSDRHFEQYYKQTQNNIQMHNRCVGENDLWLCVGDISESELHKAEDIAALYNMIKSLHGRKILIIGNNDNFDDEFYYKCGFEYVSRSYIATPQYIFSHEPQNMAELKVSSDVLNLHGHLHGAGSYRNMDWKQHIDVFHGKHDGSVLQFSQYLDNYRNGMYRDYYSTYATFATDNVRV